MKDQTHVVVLGAGYAGLMAAMRLARKTDPGVAITLVNAGDTFHERVRHHQLAAGQSLRSHSLESILRGTRIELLPGTATAWQPSGRQVTVQTGAGERSLAYDYLVYAPGSFVDTHGVPGAREHAYTLDHASTLALAGRLPGLAAGGGRLLVVGGGNTGVEVATELAESYPGLKITLATRRSFAYNLSPGARTNEGGQILIDRAMRSLSHPEVYAVGAHPHGAVHGDHDGSARGGLSGRAAPGETAAAFGLSYVALGLSLGRKDGVVQFLDWNTDRPLKLVFTGKGANRMREFFVRFALWSIRAQRVAPWVFDWPGKRKMRRVAVHGPRPAAPAPAGRESAARSEG